MFEFSIYKFIKEYQEGDPLENIFSIGYGETPESKGQPYIIQQKLDKNEDPQLPCDKFGDAGNAIIQWNIFAKDNFAVDELYSKLNEILYNINDLTFNSITYTINLKATNGRPSNVSNSTMAVGVLTMTFNYIKE